jgi:hypothetical protein
MDFYLGRVTREHEDVDLFAWARDAPALVAELVRTGFVELPRNHPDVQRDLTRYGEELQIALLVRNRDGEVVVAGGPAAGALWPHGMLEGPPGRLGDLVCPIINPRAQIEIKERFPAWRPDLPRRDVHQADIERLHAAIARAAR